jgi:hypothetical protein
MGWLSVLSKVFGGGGSGGYGDYVNVAGDVASSIAANRAKGRADEGTANQLQDRNVLARYIAEQNAKEAAAKFTEDATRDRADRTLTNARDRAKQVVQGDIMANLQPAHLQGLPSYIPKMSFGGGAINALGPATRASGRNLAQQALLAQMSGSDIPGMPDASQLGTAAPDVTPLPESGKLDSILNTVGAIGLGAKGIGAAQDARRKAQAEAEARNNPQEIPHQSDFNGQSSAMTGAGAIAPGQLAQLLALKRMQDQQNQAD